MGSVQYFICKVSQDKLVFKNLKFKVHKQDDCLRLMKQVKARNIYVYNASLEIHLDCGKVYFWRFNPNWYKITGDLIPMLKDVKKSLESIKLPV